MSTGSGSSPFERLGLRLRWRLRLAWLCALPWLAFNAHAEAPTYTLSVVPQFQAVDISRVWSPILARLAQESGATLKLKVAKDIPTFEADVQAGQPDFAYLNPYHQLMAHKAQGYVPLVRDATPLTGILVVRRDDPIRSVKELQGKTLAFPAPNALGASLLIRSHLAEVDHIDITAVYAKTHTNAYRQTLMGKTAASGGLRATLQREPDEVEQGLRILFETPGVAAHPLSAHPRVPAAVQQAVATAFMRLADEAALKESYQDIPMPRPVRADQQRDYQPLARFKLERYVE